MRIERLFTSAQPDPYTAVAFTAREAMGDVFDPPLEHPEGWSREAVEILADEAALHSLPAAPPLEENTVPSWLWQHAQTKQVGEQETSVAHVFNRVAGAAAYRGWKGGLFKNEEAARVFFDEIRYALIHRLLVLEPAALATMGAAWAYGTVTVETAKPDDDESLPIANADVDALVGGHRDPALQNLWKRATRAKESGQPTSLRFADNAGEWGGMADSNATRGWLNLLYLRHNDGSVNIDALRHVTRLAVALFDLSFDTPRPIALGTLHLATLLLAQGLAYDSDEARTMAAALHATLTAEAYAASARLAERRGLAPTYARQRENTLRHLRNRRRAAYGEPTDYEKLSITPAPLDVHSCPDLALAAAAQQAWGVAVELAHTHGLRHTHVTDLTVTPAAILLAESASEGMMPPRHLTGTQDSRQLHPSVTEAVIRCGGGMDDAQSLQRHVTGTLSLADAPAINHASLCRLGFTTAVLEKLEAALPTTRRLRFAVTPWVLGVEFCRKILKIPAAKLDDLSFNLLTHLGFTTSDIAKAERHVYGHGTARSHAFADKHAALFVTATDVSAEACIRMAAALQPFVSGNVGLTLHMAQETDRAPIERLLLEAWRQGVSCLSLRFDEQRAPIAAKPVAMPRAKLGKKLAVHAAKAHTLPRRKSRSVASGKTVAVTHGKGKPRPDSKSH